MTFSSDYLAIRVLETRLAESFGDDGVYAAKYATYGGVDVKLRTDEDSEPENVGKPLLLLEQSSGARSEWSSAKAEYRDVEVTVTSYVSDSSGAQQGTANPITSDELLSRDLVIEFQENYATWRDLGLAGIQISSGALAVNPNSTWRRISHSIQFKYYKGGGNDERERRLMALVIPPTGPILDATAPAVPFDKKDFLFAHIFIAIGETDLGLSNLQIVGCDTIDGVYTPVEPPLDATVAESNQIYAVRLELDYCQKYISVVATVPAAVTTETGAYISAVAMLTRDTETPNKAPTTTTSIPQKAEILIPGG